MGIRDSLYCTMYWRFCQVVFLNDLFFFEISGIFLLHMEENRKISHYFTQLQSRLNLFSYSLSLYVKMRKMTVLRQSSTACPRRFLYILHKKIFPHPSTVFLVFPVKPCGKLCGNCAKPWFSMSFSPNFSPKAVENSVKCFFEFFSFGENFLRF